MNDEKVGGKGMRYDVFESLGEGSQLAMEWLAPSIQQGGLVKRGWQLTIALGLSRRMDPRPFFARGGFGYLIGCPKRGIGRNNPVWSQACPPCL